MTLYEISAEYQKLLESSIDENGMISEDAIAELEELDGAINDKLDNIACYIKNLTALADGIAAERKAMQEREKSISVNIDRLKKMILDYMQQSGTKKIETVRNKISTRMSSKVEILSEADIPEEFLTVKTTTAPDKAAIKEAISSGKTVAGAQIVSNVNLTLK